MVWIHSGAFVGKAVPVPILHEMYLPDYGVILMTFNYRFGHLGRLASPSSVPGMARRLEAPRSKVTHWFTAFTISEALRGRVGDTGPLRALRYTIAGGAESSDWV